MRFLTKEIVWRDFETIGLDSTEPHDPNKAEIRAYLGQLEIAALLGAVMVKTKAELDAVIGKEDYAPAIVGADPNQALSGYYQWKDDEWHYVRDFADSITRLINVAGTANEITAALRAGASLSALEFAVFVPRANNSGAVTLTLGGVSLPIRNGLGAELDPDDLQTGFPAMLAVIEGQEGYVLINPANVEAVVLAAKAATLEARDDAQSAMGAAEAALDQLEEAVTQASQLAYERFNKLYLGAFDADPNTDNTGNPLEEGALYLNRPTRKLKMYTSNGWDLATPDTSDFVRKDQNLGDLPSKSEARKSLELGNLSMLDKVGNAQIESGAVSEAKLGTNAVTTVKLKDKAVTDTKLNSAKLNTLAASPRIIAAASVIAAGRFIWRKNLDIVRSSTTYRYTFTPRLPASVAVNYAVSVTPAGGPFKIVVKGKTATGFEIEFYVAASPSAADHDVIVVGVW